MASINITKVDNELFVLALSEAASYQLAHIQSGKGHAVNVFITLLPGAATEYAQPQTFNGVEGPITQTYIVTLPAGTYTVFVVGINWGGPTEFEVTVGSTSLSLPDQNQPPGYAWVPNPLPTIKV